MLSLIGILVGLVVLIFLSYKGYPLVPVTIISSIIVILTGGIGLVTGIKDYFMDGFVTFTRNYYMLILSSTLFAKLMGDSGAARAIADSCVKLVRKFPGKEKYMAVFAMLVVASVLSAGGISAFVISFVMVPIGVSVFQALNVPWHLFRCYSLGTGTYTLGGLPGMPAVNNIVPTSYLGTTASAGPVLGVIASIFMLVTGCIYIFYAVRKTIRKGEGFMETGHRIVERFGAKNTDELPQKIKFWQALIPPVAVLVLLNFVNLTSATAMFCGCGICYLLFHKNLPHVVRVSMGGSAKQAADVICTTSCVVGFGSCVSAVPGFTYFVNALNALNLSGPLQIVIIVAICCGLTGSSSGGLTITYNAFLEKFQSFGLDPQTIHRISAIASNSLDSLPHSSAIVVGLEFCGLTHGEAYVHSGWLCTVIPMVASILVAVIAGPLNAMGIF